MIRFCKSNSLYTNSSIDFSKNGNLNYKLIQNKHELQSEKKVFFLVLISFDAYNLIRRAAIATKY